MRKQKSSGFTIVETLIVLAVTGVMFVSTAVLVSGQVSRYRYRDAMFRFEGQVQGQINDVLAGYFAREDGPVGGCPGNSQAGRNTNCKIIGKKLVFSDSKLTATSLAMLNDDSFEDTADSIFDMNYQEVIDFPGGVLRVLGASPPNTDVTVYVVFKAATIGATYVGGSQSVGIYDANRNSVTTPIKLCIKDGSRHGAIELGGLYGLTASMKLEETHTGCA